MIQFESSGMQWWGRECRYLFPSGVSTIRKGGSFTKDGGENEHCLLFRY